MDKENRLAGRLDNKATTQASGPAARVLIRSEKHLFFCNLKILRKYPLTNQTAKLRSLMSDVNTDSKQRLVLTLQEHRGRQADSRKQPGTSQTLRGLA